MEELYNELTQKAINLMNESNGNRILIGIAGPPGSGKTTTAKNVCEKINQKQDAEIAAVMPMDGFHFTRNELSKMENPEYLFKRRGAPFTFNSKELLEKVKELKCSKTLVTAPSFNHSIKDPKENDIQISSTIKIVILEGNYLLLKDPIWCEISKELNQKWLITADWEIIKERLIQRHLNAGICSNFNEALERANENDIPNGKYIIENSVKPDFTFRGDI
uniref:Phosphoribulokinase/uridine kinase domain-containing protein n=1 Tax=Panagrolaimus sp. PS1159 TaxID=55785 RepID=A0AC35GVW1_9BILA